MSSRHSGSHVATFDLAYFRIYASSSRTAASILILAQLASLLCLIIIWGSGWIICLLDTDIIERFA